MRCNVGVNPIYLFDQHLTAELVEIPMVIGSLKYWNWEIKSHIPEKFKLGEGHMNFLKIRLKYLKRRHEEVKKEIRRRRINNQKSNVDLTDIPEKFLGDWEPTLDSTNIIRSRIIERILAKPKYWRYYRQYPDNTEFQILLHYLKNGELFYV